jgi:hypothetical protein
MPKKAKIGTFLDGFMPITQARKVQIAKFKKNSNSPYSINPENMFLIKNSKTNFFHFFDHFSGPYDSKIKRVNIWENKIAGITRRALLNEPSIIYARLS